MNPVKLRCPESYPVHSGVIHSFYKTLRSGNRSYKSHIDDTEELDF
jgi:hypothetical protein